MTRFQCQTVNLKNDSFYYTTDKLSRFTHGAFASMWALPRSEISRNFLPLQTVDLVHLCRELVHKSGQSLRVCVSHFLPQTPHDPTDISRSGIPINSPRKDGPESSMLQKSSHFGPKNKGSHRQSVGVWAGKCSSMNCWFAFVEWGCAKSCSKIISLFFVNIFRLWIGRPFVFFRCKTSSKITFFKTFSW